MATQKQAQEIVLELQANDDGSVSFVAVTSEAPAVKSGAGQPAPAPEPEPAPAPVSESGNPDRLELVAEREIVLRCGEASLTLTRAGKIILRGTYLLSRSSGVNKIKGGSVQIN